MPGFLLHSGARVLCIHPGGQAKPKEFNKRVKVSNQPIVTLTNFYGIEGCSFVPPQGNGPCVTAQWRKASKRVKAGGEAVLLQDSEAKCTPTGTGLNILDMQKRVKGI